MPSPPPVFLFATGIENSNPTIDHGRTRVDEMESCGHYRRWREDFDCVQALGISYLRYGPPLPRTFRGPGRYDWEFADLTFAELLEREIVPIADLCHFGVPDWMGNFQNPDFPELFARYAGAFARRFPWVQLYTPINEMYVCALFSARYGWWNEQLKSTRAYITALKHLVRGNVLAMHAILAARPDAIFVQSETTEHFHPDSPAAFPAADFRNEERFLSLDLNYGRRVDSEMYEYLRDNGVTRAEYEFFLANNLKRYCVMGNDYYLTNEHRIAPDGSVRSAGEIFGYDEITAQYYRRYGLPVMHTETNYPEGADGEGAVNWLHKQWAKLMQCRRNGMPMVGFTWYSLTDQIDWDCALREVRNHVNPLGLYDLDRRIRRVGTAYRQLIADWREILPTRSLALTLPIVPLSSYKTTSRGHRKQSGDHGGRWLRTASTRRRK